MSNNFWNQQQSNSNSNNSAENNGAPPRTGRLLRDYGSQQQVPQRQPGQFSPSGSGLLRQGPPSYSPMPPQQPQQQWGPPPQYQQPQGGYPPQHQGWVNNTIQAVRSWSGKMGIVQRGNVPQEPMVRYRSPSPTFNGHQNRRTPPRPQPWKRSRSMRITLQMRRRRERWEKNRPNAKKIWGGIGISFLAFLVILLTSTVYSAYAYYQTQLPLVQGLANSQLSQTTHIYDRNGTLLYDVFDQSTGSGGRRTPIAYKDIPKVLQDAMVAAEDQTFWDNSGVDPQGILRAATEYFSTHSVQGGGSTITQQLVKNLTHSTDVSINRKLPEAALAIGLTQQYPKTKILEMYFNVAPFGSQDLGVESATQEYFHLKPQCDQNFKCTPAITFLDVDANGKHNPLLALARASLLAAIPNNPVEFDPTLGDSYKAAALGRQDYVLSEMLKLGDSVDGLGPITTDIINQAEALTAKMTFTRYTHTYTCCPHYVNWIISQLDLMLGNGDPTTGELILFNGGFNIRTTIDANLEKFVEAAIHRHLDEPEYQKLRGFTATLTDPLFNVNDAAAVVMDAKTGEILAMAGSADYNSTDPKVNGNFNAADADPGRQPGSTFKPIVYLSAFEQGWYPGIVLPDVKTYFPTSNAPVSITNTYTPTDYGARYNNITTGALTATIRFDTANSFNVPAVKALRYAGLDNVINMARRMGITAIDHDLALYNAAHPNHQNTLDQYFNDSLALGTAEIPLVQMVGAYQVLANQGVRVQRQSILDIWDNYGHHLYHFDPAHPNSSRVVSAQLAYMVTAIISDEPARAYEFESDHDLSFYDWNPTYQVAAKTGTTDNFKDNWTIGYTPDVVVGVWAGNANNEPLGQDVIGITGAAPIWHSIIERIMNAPVNNDGADIPWGSYVAPYHDTQFVVPPGIHQACTSGIDGLAAAAGAKTICDWMINGMDPIQVGTVKTNNGTGPGSGSPTPTPTP